MFFFKAEANSTVGGGHLHRCISIAKECTQQGQEVAFIFAETPQSSIQLIKELEFPVIIIDKEKQLDYKTYQPIIPEGSFILFDTDNPQFYSGNLIDDLNNNGVLTGCFTITDKFKISTTVLINTNIISRTHHYDTPKETIQLLGPEYLIFNPIFRKNQITPHEQGKYDKLLLFFGNADANNLTNLILRTISQITFSFEKIIVVVGALNPHRKEIETQIGQMKGFNIEYHFNAPNMLALYQQTDIAITAAGMTMWEMALFKIPQLVVASSEREITYTKYLEKVNFIKLLGSYSEIQSNEDLSVKIDTNLKYKELENLDLDSFRNSINPNGINKMANILVSLVGN